MLVVPVLLVSMIADIADHYRQMSLATTLQSLHVKRPVSGKQHWQPFLGTLNARVFSRIDVKKPTSSSKIPGKESSFGSRMCICTWAPQVENFKSSVNLASCPMS